jgi:hypothetical protein
MTESRNAPHLLRVEESPERYAPLIAAAQALDLRIGWLDFSVPSPVPEPLETAAALGVLRAVAAGGSRSVAVKPLKGAPVLRDLLREHFRGCVLVLVRGEAPADIAALRSVERSVEEAWTVTAPGEAARPFTTAALAAALRRPRPWGPPLPPRPVRPEPDPTKKKKRRRDQRVKRAKEKKAKRA